MQLVIRDYLRVICDYLRLTNHKSQNDKKEILLKYKKSLLHNLNSGLIDKHEENQYPEYKEGIGKSL